jgi:transaldolase
MKRFVDTADLAALRAHAARRDIHGATTNPSLARRAGVVDYAPFCRAAAELFHPRPVSVEVVADEPGEMGRQARRLAALGENVVVKVPVSDTRGRPTADVVRGLACDGVRVNVTALFTLAQAVEMAEAASHGAPAILSVFAGRIADTGVDPVPHVAAIVRAARAIDPRIEVLWASPREVLNVVHAEQAGCHVITLTPELIAKLAHFGRDLGEYSLETVRMLTGDALAAGYRL